MQHGVPFDVVMYNERLEVTETSIANIAVLLPGSEEVWCTPPLSCGVLPGCWRARMLASKQLVERVVSLDELRAAARASTPACPRIKCFNSVRGEYYGELQDQHAQT